MANYSSAVKNLHTIKIFATFFLKIIFVFYESRIYGATDMGRDRKFLPWIEYISKGYQRQSRVDWNQEE